MIQLNQYPCACMGKQGNDPYCPCVMRSLGMEPSLVGQPITPEQKAKFMEMFRSDAR